ncbi:MAG TPA: hypothetical protein VKQ72_22630 [Aggregatilineales bacterium]|nr:hypothetical protein [Aggregatilineales bacterium]
MGASFEILQDDIIANRYREPLTADDIQAMMKQDDDYARSHVNRVHIVADFSDIKMFPVGLLTIGIRPTLNNPVHNPKIGSILVICNSPFLTQLVSVVSRVIHINKLGVSKDWNEANLELAKLSQSYRVGRV